MKIRQQRTIEKNICNKMILLSFCMILMVSMAGCGNKRKENLTITNVSYDPTREFYEKYNKDFIKYYKDKYGKKVEVIQSHGGSGSQARSVVEGSNGDVVTLALEHDISLIEQTGLINKGWQKRFSNDSAPYTSTIVFLVRKGNKKSIKDWKDLIKKGVEVITPDPKSSGGACWNFLAAYGYAIDTYHDQKKEEQFLTKLYQNVSVMDSGARGSTTTFVENKKGDVLIAWENEAIQTVKNYPDKYEIITPSISILAQPSVSLVDDNVKVNGTMKIATEYLKYLYSDKAQKLAAEEGYRPSNERILKQYQGKFNLNMKLYNISDFVDTALFNNVMAAQGFSKKEYASLLGIFQGQYSTMINVPLSISSALAASLVPSLVATVQTGNRKQVHNKINTVSRFNMLIAIPCAVGFITLAKPILNLLYFTQDNTTAARMLQMGALSVVFFCLSTVTNSVLQGLDDMMTPVKNAAISLVIIS